MRNQTCDSSHNIGFLITDSVFNEEFSVCCDCDSNMIFNFRLFLLQNAPFFNTSKLNFIIFFILSLSFTISDCNVVFYFFFQLQVLNDFVKSISIRLTIRYFLLSHLFQSVLHCGCPQLVRFRPQTFCDSICFHPRLISFHDLL